VGPKGLTGGFGPDEIDVLASRAEGTGRAGDDVAAIRSLLNRVAPVVAGSAVGKPIPLRGMVTRRDERENHGRAKPAEVTAVPQDFTHLLIHHVLPPPSLELHWLGAVSRKLQAVGCCVLHASFRAHRSLHELDHLVMLRPVGRPV
jgi:hypothetical protein